MRIRQLSRRDAIDELVASRAAQPWQHPLRAKGAQSIAMDKSRHRLGGLRQRWRSCQLPRDLSGLVKANQRLELRAESKPHPAVNSAGAEARPGQPSTASAPHGGTFPAPVPEGGAAR